MNLFLQLLGSGLVVGAMYALFALGFAFVFAVTRVFHLAQAATYTLAAFVFYLVYVEAELHPVLAVLVAAATAICFGVLCELVVYRPLRHRSNGDQISTLVVALGVVIVVENAVGLLFGTQPRGYSSSDVTSSVRLLGISLTVPQVQIVVVAVLVLLLSLAFIRYTRPGREMAAVSDNPELAELIGVSVRRTYVWAFVAGSLVVAIAALMVGRNTGIYPTMGLNPVLVGAVAVIVAGNGRLLPVFGSAVVMGLLENLAVLRLPSSWQPTVLFGALVIVLLARPYGLFSSRERSFVQWSS
ncbi:MAG: hypothetical protein GEU94_01320 [Micromonosporaceae bacterium]|nr:hypothetical protein [Micromonosporaceae bacterium]